MEKLNNIHSLVMQEIGGDLSEPDRVHLLQLASEDPEVAEVRDYLWKTVGSDEVAKYISQHPVEEQTAKLLGQLNTPRHTGRRIVYIGTAVAAAAAIIIMFNTGVFTSKKQLELAQGNNQPDTNKNVQLALSTGNVYDINNDTAMSAANSKWKITNKTLTLEDNRSETEQYATLRVPAGKDYSLVLPDGSRIQVNAASTVKFPLAFKKNVRDIYVTGEAFIHAAADPSKPFRVHLSGSVVDVLGTEFNVNTYDSLAKIALVSGSVKVSSSKTNTILKPGSMGIVSSSGISVSGFDEYETLSWRTGRFVFRNAKFEDVCKVIPRWFGVRVVLDNNQLSDKRFSGMIDRYQPLELQLKGLKATGAIDYHITGDSTIHVKFM
ncbi:FecR family protein [Chitinophaga sp. S165]|uniref:FecR family protein n=1 Tax=Chitinophaga sp. S165 TaxID=2135462 RepID=UPI000D713C3A|nr:FecR family protein [Chitinophaga sp. S165]PWV45804.1 FecR family protein [Chitinophaga sp. S165]